MFAPAAAAEFPQVTDLPPEAIVELPEAQGEYPEAPVSLPEAPVVLVLLLGCCACLFQLRLAWRILNTRSEVAVLNYSLALTFAVSG